MVLTNGYQFRLGSDDERAVAWSLAKGAEPHQLPTYVGAWGRGEQVFLTPLAVTVDASVAGAVIFAVLRSGTLPLDLAAPATR